MALGLHGGPFPRSPGVPPNAAPSLWDAAASTGEDRFGVRASFRDQPFFPW